MRIRKCKYKNKKMKIEYEKKNAAGGYDYFTMVCEDEPRPEYERAIEKLNPFVTELCELPGELNSRITVRSVSFSFGGDAGIMGAVLSATMTLKKSNGVLMLNTPHKPSAHYNPMPMASGDDSALLPDRCVDILKTLQEECAKYVEGDRAQGDMFKGKAKK